MVERVARAIEGRWHQGAINSLELAHVAIYAMREPTDEMVWAGEQSNSEDLCVLTTHHSRQR
mgnify:CR=1 FL=1